MSVLSSAGLMPRQRLAVLGATGSIGTSTLDIVTRHPERFSVEVLAAGRQYEALFQLCLRHHPRYAVLSDVLAANLLRGLCAEAGLSTHVLSGMDAMIELVVLPEIDIVVSGIVGAQGCLPTLAAVKAGKRILLANKESLVLSGHIMMEEARKSGAILMPVDSEHNALFQCWEARSPERGIHCDSHRVTSICLTASGGPFRGYSHSDLRHVTPAQACRHPRWEMGQKVSVDSATLMNKALEMIEAYWLFGLPFDAIHAVVHPQSIVHAMVGYVDGSTLAQCGYPDMRVPIAYGLSYPDRIETGVASLDYFKLGSLVFEEPDHACFPALKMVAEVVKSAASAPIIFNAANEVAVAEFLKGRLPFLRIYDLVSAALDVCEQQDILTIDDALEVDANARAFASEWCQRNAYADASVLI